MLLTCSIHKGYGQLPFRYLNQEKLAPRWDEGIPLGNGMLGAILWQRTDQIRFALDRADLWDERPIEGLHGPHFRFKWVQEKWRSGSYKDVQKAMDVPYDMAPAATKIPGAAMEIPASIIGKQHKVELDLYTAALTVLGEGGSSITSFVHATEHVGWIKIKNVQKSFFCSLIPPAYQAKAKIIGDIVGGDDLGRLGYEKGKIDSGRLYKTYLQKGWNNFHYRVTVVWKFAGPDIELVWRIDVSESGRPPKLDLTQLNGFLSRGFDVSFFQHQAWWKQHWAKSSIVIPDPTLLRQWYITRYFMGSTSRKGAPPISLQSIWTADNGRLPPWKGDYHHDLNTELSYWPFYSANDLENASVFIDHLEGNKKNYTRYTRDYFEVEGLNVPGVTTLKGTEMGGWIQYALSPTISCWLAHHYDLQWKYSMDKKFLRRYAYPWFKNVCRFLENISYIDSAGCRHLPLSSSPEFFDNDSKAWFNKTSNYDLSLMHYALSKASLMAKELHKEKESRRWLLLKESLPPLDLSSKNTLTIAPGVPYNFSHRHFSHLISIYPLGILTKDKDSTIMQNSLNELSEVGTKEWGGYSFAWQGNLYARLGDGVKAANALKIFSTAFCLSANGFHVNGDQSGKGYSNATYRPFTLEGNFAFASGLQEMLLQSHNGYIEIMPAIPNDWQDVSFYSLRAEGAYNIDAERKKGVLKKVHIISDADGELNMKLEGEWDWTIEGEVTNIKFDAGFFSAKTVKGSKIIFHRR